MDREFEERLQDILDTISTEKEEVVDDQILFISFNKNDFFLKEVDDIDDIEIIEGNINWIYMVGLNNVDDIIQLKDLYSIHPLVIEDILSGDQRTKAESYRNSLYVVTDIVDYSDYNDTNEMRFDQVSFILKHDVLITVDERDNHLFDNIINKLESVQAYRHKSTDALLFTLIDRIVDNYFVVFDIIGEKIDDLEDMMNDPEEDALNDLYRIKKDLIYLRKTLWPLRSVVNSISKSQFSLIDDVTSYYFRDVYDHLIQMIDLIEIYRETINSMIDSLNTNIGNRTNDVMMILTVISTIFLPLTFLSGVFGMNFEYLPGQYQPLAFPLFWMVCLMIVLAMIIYFRRKDWI